MIRFLGAFLWAGVWVGVWVASGCGGSAGGIKPSSPFTDEHARLFDDGVDLVSEPDKQPGRWGDDWRADLEGRMAESDAVAVGTVTTVHTDVNLDGKTSYRVVLDVDETPRGPLPSDELSLRSSEDAQGYPTMQANRERILNRRMIAFIKWYRGADGTAAHWHISPASEQVAARVRDGLEEKRVFKRTVIEHKSD